MEDLMNMNLVPMAADKGPRDEEMLVLSSISESAVPQSTGSTGAGCTHLNSDQKLEQDTDNQKSKRIQKSREYSKKYRLKQLKYTMHLEGKVKELQNEVAVTYPRIEYYGRQRLLMKMQNSVMQRRISGLTNELMFKEAQTQELKEEIDMLKQQALVAQKQPLALMMTEEGTGIGNLSQYEFERLIEQGRVEDIEANENYFSQLQSAVTTAAPPSPTEPAAQLQLDFTSIHYDSFNYFQQFTCQLSP